MKFLDTWISLGDEGDSLLGGFLGFFYISPKLIYGGSLELARLVCGYKAIEVSA